jgi:hypothetical protein
MQARGINHPLITGTQHRLFNQLARDVAAGVKQNTLKEHTRIAVESLVAAGVPEQQARHWVAVSLANLRSQGVTQPTGIPWN